MYGKTVHLRSYAIPRTELYGKVVHLRATLSPPAELHGKTVHLHANYRVGHCIIIRLKKRISRLGHQLN